MPTLNPRISVTLQPSIDAVLRRLSAITGTSVSALVSDLLNQSEPIFERLVVTLEAAEKVRASLSKDALRAFEDGEQRLHEQLGITLELFDSASKPIIDQAESIGRRAAPTRAGGTRNEGRGRVARAALPPYVTRGSGTPNTVNKTISDITERRQPSPSKPIKTPSTTRKSKVKG